MVNTVSTGRLQMNSGEKWSYFFLWDLESLSGPNGQKVEFDAAFTPSVLSQALIANR